MIWRWGWAREGNSQIFCSECKTCDLPPFLASLPLLCLVLFLSRMLSTKFSLWLWSIQSWGTRKTSKCSALVRIVTLAFVTLPHPVPLPMYAQLPWTSRSLVLVPVWIVSIEWEKFWFQGCYAHCCLDVVKVVFWLLAFCCLLGKTDFLQSLIKLKNWEGKYEKM